MRTRPASSSASALYRAWPFVAARGVLAVVVATVVLTRPGMARSLLLATLGSYLFIDGLLALGTALLAERGAMGRGRYALEGLVSVTVGALAFAHPTAIAGAAMALIAARALISGAVELATAISLGRSGGENHWPIGLSGLASLGFGAFVLARPASGALIVLLLAGLYVMLFGFGMLGAAFRLRRAGARLQRRAPA